MALAFAVFPTALIFIPVWLAPKSVVAPAEGECIANPKSPIKPLIAAACGGLRKENSVENKREITFFGSPEEVDQTDIRSTYSES